MWVVPLAASASMAIDSISICLSTSWAARPSKRRKMASCWWKSLFTAGILISKRTKDKTVGVGDKRFYGEVTNVDEVPLIHDALDEGAAG